MEASQTNTEQPQTQPVSDVAPPSPVPVAPSSTQAPAAQPTEPADQTPVPTKAAPAHKSTKPVVTLVLTTVIFLALVVLTYYAYAKTK